MITHSPKLPRKRHLAVIALLENRTIKEAAQAIGIGEATLFRWLQDHDFLKAYREAKGRLVDHAISKLQKASGEAVETLREVMRDKGKPASSRVTAARTILEMSIKAVELSDLTTRIEELEHIVESKQ